MFLNVTSGGNTVTITLPPRVSLVLTTANGIDGGTGAAFGFVTLSQPNSGNMTFLRIDQGRTDDIQTYDLSMTGQPRSCQIQGTWRNLTMVTPLTTSDISVPHLIEAGVRYKADITGPANIDLSLGLPGSSSGGLILRGKGIVGKVSGHNRDMSDGAMLSYVAASQSVIIASVNQGTLSGTVKPYAFDASSNDNFLIFEKTGVFPAAGTDAGLRNIVLPDAFPGGMPGPHVIEDEGVGLTQRANLNFVGAGVTVTDSAPDTVVTIPGGTVTYDNPVESQFGDAMAQGIDTDTARADHKHDRHDDAIHHFSKVNA